MSNFVIGTGSGGVGTAVVTVGQTFQHTNAANNETLDSLVLTAANSPLYEQLITLSSGANTITVPPLSGGVIVVPPSANTQSIVLKGVTGDTGVTLSKTAPFMLTFDTTPPANFVLTAGGTITGARFIWL